MLKCTNVMHFGLAVYLLVFQGGTAAGSAFWGMVAERVGLSVALLGAAFGLLSGLGALVRYRLIVEDDRDLTPSLHWPEPIVTHPPPLEDGPVLVMIEYDIDPVQADAFLQAMDAVRLERTLPARVFDFYLIASCC